MRHIWRMAGLDFGGNFTNTLQVSGMQCRRRGSNARRAFKAAFCSFDLWHHVLAYACSFDPSINCSVVEPLPIRVSKAAKLMLSALNQRVMPGY